MHIIKTLEGNIAVAVSGGIDSVVLLHYLNKKYDVTALHYVHNSDISEKEYDFVSKLCYNWDIPLLVEFQKKELVTNISKEKYWRDGRYAFFKSIKDYTVCTGHTLDDMVSWYLLTCLRGEGHLMPYSNNNAVRPFLCTKKEEIFNYAQKHNINWFEDVSNKDVDFTYRNRIVENIIPECLKINEGLYTTIKNKFLEKNKNIFLI